MVQKSPTSRAANDAKGCRNGKSFCLDSKRASRQQFPDLYKQYRKKYSSAMLIYLLRLLAAC